MLEQDRLLASRFLFFGLCWRDVATLIAKEVWSSRSCWQVWLTPLAVCKRYNFDEHPNFSCLFAELGKLSHPNVAALLASETTRPGNVYVALEYLQFNLTQWMMRSCLSENDVRSLFMQLLCGIVFLHESRVLHRNIKPSNILISPDGLLKLTDCGLIRLAHPLSYCVEHWQFQPPELLSVETPSFRGREIDAWSAGCIRAEMESGGKRLFPGRSKEDILSAIARNHQQCVGLLDLDPQKRQSCQDALAELEVSLM